MKKLVLTSICTLGALGAFGQGAINFANNPTGFKAPVYAPETESPGVMLVGQSSIGNPVGSTVFDGGLVGSGYDFALFAAASGSTSNQLQLIGAPVSFRSSATGALPQGTIITTTLNVPGVVAGNPVAFQLRAWNTEGGTITTWAQALAQFALGTDPLAQIGWTPVLTSGVLGGIDTAGNVDSNPTTTGWTSFSLINNVSSPEPASLALGGLGALGLLFFRRRK